MPLTIIGANYFYIALTFLRFIYRPFFALIINPRYLVISTLNLHLLILYYKLAV